MTVASQRIGVDGSSVAFKLHGRKFKNSQTYWPILIIFIKINLNDKEKILLWILQFPVFLYLITLISLTVIELYRDELKLHGLQNFWTKTDIDIVPWTKCSERMSKLVCEDKSLSPRILYFFVIIQIVP